MYRFYFIYLFILNPWVFISGKNFAEIVSDLEKCSWKTCMWWYISYLGLWRMPSLCTHTNVRILPLPSILSDGRLSFQLRAIFTYYLFFPILFSFPSGILIGWYMRITVYRKHDWLRIGQIVDFSYLVKRDAVGTTGLVGPWDYQGSRFFTSIWRRCGFRSHHYQVAVVPLGIP